MVFISICTALYDYTPQSDNELALQEGEIVYILEKSSEDDWWKAKKRAPSDDEDEPIGLIPNNYVAEAQPTHQAKALYDYSRQTDEELSFTEEAVLFVYDTSDADWTLVGMDEEYGFAPSNYIEITAKAEQKSPQAALSSQTSEREVDSQQPLSPVGAVSRGPAAAMAGIMQQKSSSADLPPANTSLPPRRPQLPPEDSDEEPPAP